MTQSERAIARRRSALVVSPFASWPLNAGRRRRVWQVTKLLAAGGYDVTFLLLACENGWAWRHDDTAHAAMRAQWGDVLVVYASERLGAPPRDGGRHGRDEWWDPALEAALANLLRGRFFDVMLVYGVWLSRAFSSVHAATVKLFDPHGAPWREDAAAGFAIGDDDALLALARAELVLTMREAEARALLAQTPRRVLNVPYYDPSLETEPAPAALRDPSRVTFGLVGSDTAANTEGLAALIACLEVEADTGFLPLEIVVGGTIGQSVRTRLPLRRLGPIGDVRGFYGAVDHAVVPVFSRPGASGAGGFDIKCADAVAAGVPLLASSRAGEDIVADPALLCETPRSMAARMAAISLRRPDPRPAQARVLGAREALRARTAAAAETLLETLATARAALVIDLHDADIVYDALKLQSWLGLAGTLAARAPVLFILADTVRHIVAASLPPAAKAIDLASFTVHADEWKRRVTIDATARGSRRLTDLRDGRWSDGGAGSPLVEAMPLFHPGLLREPAAARLREAWDRSLCGIRARFRPGPLLLRNGAVEHHYVLGDNRHVTLLDPEDDAALQAAVMRMLVGPRLSEVIWAACGPRSQRRIVRDACAAAAVPYRGPIDDVALAPPDPPIGIRDEITRAARETACALTTAEVAAPA